MILVTGSQGYIGKHLTSMLSLSKKEFLGIDISQGRHAESSQNFEKIDILDLKSMKNLFSRNRFTHVIHLAALKSVAESFDNQEKYFQVNLDGTSNLFKLAKEFGVKEFIFGSSAAVYEPTSIGEGALTENSRLNPSSPYGKSKLAAEEYILENLNASIVVTILRFFNVSGCVAGVSDPLVGDNIIPTILRSIKNERELKVFGSMESTRDGSCIRDYIDVRDLVEVLVKLVNLEKNDLRNEFDIFNLGSGVGTSVLELVSFFELNLNKKIDVRLLKPRIGEPSVSISEILRLSNHLNWSPKYTVADTVSNLSQIFSGR